MSGGNGYYRMHRGWMENEVFAKEKFTERLAWVWLIENAAYEPCRVRVGKVRLSLQRGQLAHSLRFMAKAWRWDWSRVGRFLERLKNDAMIDTDTATGVTVISITKYDIYQAPWNHDATATPQTTPQQHHSSTTDKNERNKLNKDSSVPKGTGVAPTLIQFPDQPNPVKQLFDLGVDVMVKAGVPTAQARSLVGKWRKEVEDEDLIGFLIAAGKATNPIEYVQGAIRKHRNPHGQAAL